VTAELQRRSVDAWLASIPNTPSRPVGHETAMAALDAARSELDDEQ
jgi:hypothetical protein